MGDTSSEDDSISLGPVPLPDDVVLEYTYPRDFKGTSSWRDVVAAGQYFRLIVDPTVTEMPDSIFRNCRTLIEVIFRGNKLVRIGEFAFSGCINLTSVPLPDGLVHLGNWAFHKCESFAGRLVIPKSVLNVGIGCFYDCCSLTSLDFEPSKTAVELSFNGFKGCTQLRSVRLPRNLSSIPVQCFLGCRSLTTIDTPKYLEEISVKAFDGCTSLESITIRSSNRLHIYENLFTNCSSLVTINIVDPKNQAKIFQNIIAAMHADPDFIYRCFRKYHAHIRRSYPRHLRCARDSRNENIELKNQHKEDQIEIDILKDQLGEKQVENDGLKKQIDDLENRLDAKQTENDDVKRQLLLLTGDTVGRDVISCGGTVNNTSPSVASRVRKRRRGNS